MLLSRRDYISLTVPMLAGSVAGSGCRRQSAPAENRSDGAGNPEDRDSYLPLTDRDLTRLRDIVPPQAGEDHFATIPWQVDLWEARRIAAKKGLPIFLWEMDGHPLGCG